MSDLENRTRYDASEAEPRVFERWEASGRFHPEPVSYTHLTLPTTPYV